MFVGSDVTPAIDLLANLAHGGRALELAVGTGRLALPLAERGVEVVGVDSSESMVARMRDKPRAQVVAVTVGDMADVPIAGSFDLVYVVAHSHFALLTQARQVDCFRSAARVLAPGGAFVLECFVPDLRRLDRGVRTRAVREDSVSFEVTQHDAVHQRIDAQASWSTSEGTTCGPWRCATHGLPSSTSWHSWPVFGFNSGTETGTAAHSTPPARATCRSIARADAHPALADFLAGACSRLV